MWWMSSPKRTLLQPEQPALVLAFCLVWSCSVIVGRALIGMGFLWLPQLSGWVRGGGA